jgi:hypothetical protein
MPGVWSGASGPPPGFEEKEKSPRFWVFILDSAIATI